MTIVARVDNGKLVVQQMLLILKNNRSKEIAISEGDTITIKDDTDAGMGKLMLKSSESMIIRPGQSSSIYFVAA